MWLPRSSGPVRQHPSETSEWVDPTRLKLSSQHIASRHRNGIARPADQAISATRRPARKLAQSSTSCERRRCRPGLLAGRCRVVRSTGGGVRCSLRRQRRDTSHMPSGSEVGCIALVTGGARGIGRAIVDAPAVDGHRVVAADLIDEAASRPRRTWTAWPCISMSPPALPSRPRSAS